MTYPILYEINQYIKQIYDVKTSIKKKLNYEFFYSFNFFYLLHNMQNFVHIFKQNNKSIYNYI